jgi:hypothetical protein
MKRLAVLPRLLIITFFLPIQNALADTNVAGTATPSASYTSSWESVAAINDGIDPPSSNDTVNRRWGTWPNTGTQWAELTWSSTQNLKGADVYFFDDGGGVRVPASWKLQYWNGSAYVDVPGTYPIAVNGQHHAPARPAAERRGLGRPAGGQGVGPRLRRRHLELEPARQPGHPAQRGLAAHREHVPQPVRVPQLRLGPDHGQRRLDQLLRTLGHHRHRDRGAA